MAHKIKTWFKETSFYYWGIVLLSSMDFSEFKGEVMSVLKSIVIAVPVALFSVIFLGQIIELNGVLVNIAVTFLFTAIILLGARLFYTPAKLYFDERKKAYRFTWNEVSMTLEPKEHFGVCVIVDSNKSDYIHEAGAELIYLQKSGKIEPISKMPFPWVKDNGYTWSRKRIDRKGEINSKRTLVLAQWNKQGAWAETRVSKENTEDGKISLETDVDYKIRLQWFGAVNGRGMDEYIREYWLEYDGEKVTVKEVK